MLNIIYGKRGSGKTKKMINKANADVENRKGDLVFIDKDNHCMLDLHHSIRYINAQEYGKLTQDSFLGFVCGVMASDYDIEKIYIDGIAGLFKISSLEIIIKKISNMAEKYNVQVNMYVSGNRNNIPDCIEQHIIEE